LPVVLAALAAAGEQPVARTARNEIARMTCGHSNSWTAEHTRRNEDLRAFAGEVSRRARQWTRQ
jgi:hypothetical protein